MYRTRDLAVDGGDLIALGMEPGPQMGAFLEDLLEAVMAGDLPNERESLLAYVREKGMKP